MTHYPDRAAVLADEIRAASRTDAVATLARALARAERLGFFQARDAILSGVYAGAAKAERDAGWAEPGSGEPAKTPQGAAGGPFSAL